MKINRLLPLLALAAALTTVSCGKLEDRINSLEQRIAELEDTKIPSIDAQVTSISRTIGDMEKTDAALKEYISALQEKSAALEAEIGKTNKALEDAQTALREEISSDKAELSGEISSAKAEVVAQLEAFKTLMEGELGTLNTTISKLKAKDEELQQKTEELRAYVDSENGKLRDWADATFSTIEQQNALAETVAGIKAQFESLNSYTQTLDVRLTNRTEELAKSLSSLDESTKQQIDALTEKMTGDISALRTELTDAYTKLVATEITKLATSMKSWVNDKLAGYYTVEQTDAKLEAMKSELDGRIDSEKAYLVTLITNLETSTNKKIAANSSLITGLRGDLSSLQQSVAENAGKIADDAILIGQNAAAVSKNGAAIAANTKDLATVKSLAEENKGLIAENSAKISEMQELFNKLNVNMNDNLNKIVHNAEDIASNASLIAINTTSIQNNSAAIAQNISDIAELQKNLNETKQELIESYTSAIAKAINDYNGTITATIASEIAKIEAKVQKNKIDIDELKNKVASLDDRLSKVEELIKQITSISYIPSNIERIEHVKLWRNPIQNSDEQWVISWDYLELSFRVHPTSVAKEIVNIGNTSISAHALFVGESGTRINEPVKLNIVGLSSSDDGVLHIKIDCSSFEKRFVLGEESAVISILASTQSTSIMSDYVTVRVSIPDLDRYLLQRYYLDLGLWMRGNIFVLDMDEVKKTKELNIAGMKAGFINDILKKMPRLEKLDCSGNELLDLNLSSNLRLKELTCRNNYLSELDIVSNDKITLIDYSDNNINDENSFEQSGFLIGNTRWSIVNSWCQSSFDCGYYYDLETACPKGWRIPTKDELKSLMAYGINYVYLNGHWGWWMGGNSGTNAVFFPEIPNRKLDEMCPYLSTTTENRYYILDMWHPGSEHETSILDFDSPFSAYARCVKE